LYWLQNQSQQEVADKVNRDKSSVMRTIRTLEHKKLVKTKKDPKDSRRKIISLTETGQFVSMQIVDIITNVENEIAEVISDRPKEEFLELLKQATKKLEDLAKS